MPIILIILVIILVIILGAGSQFSSYAQQGSRISTVFLTLGIFVLGYHQWRAARHEISMDKFYDRLDMVDRRLENWPAARQMLNHFWQNSDDQASYECFNCVYVELDNLEYGIEKYKLGYMNADLALRCLRTFQSRCDSKKFREMAFKAVQGVGYHPTTAEVVKKVCKEFAD